MRTRLAAVGAGAGTVTVLVAALLVSGARGTDGPPRRAPGFRLDNVVAGRPAVDLASLRGRPTVVNFWASWCRPCAREMPALARVHRRVGERVAFVGVDHQDNRRQGLALLRRTGVTYPSGYDPGGVVAGRYRLRGMPTTVFISPAGRILEQHAGPLTEEELSARVQKLFR